MENTYNTTDCQTISKPIKINYSNSNNKITEEETYDYNLKKNYFDPTKDSSPNDWKFRLLNRLNYYYDDNDNL